MSRSLFRTLSWALIAPFGLALPTVAWGQAIIGYGINVGRAGAAGAAAGVGLGGVFSKVNQPLKRAGQEGAGASQTGKQAGPEFDNDKVPATVSVSKGNEKAAVGADGKLKLKGGTTIAGLSPSPRVARSAQLSTEAREAASSSGATGSYNPGPTPAPALRPSAAPATKTPELSAAEQASPKPTEKDLAATSGQVADESPTGSATAEQAQTTPARKRGVLSPIVGSTDPAENGAGKEVAGKEETALIAVGDKVADLIARLGKPTMVLKGIGGNGYNEKYTFRKPDGGKFTVLALHGTVTAVIDSSTGLPMRASLP